MTEFVPAERNSHGNIYGDLKRDTPLQEHGKVAQDDEVFKKNDGWD